MTLQTKKIKGMPVALVLLALGILLAAYAIWHVDTSPRTDDAYVYADTISIAPEVSGRIVEFLVKDNQLVKEGDVLFRIDPRPFESNLAKARAGLEALDRETELAERSIAAQRLNAEAASAGQKRADAAVNQAQQTLNRLAPLLKSGFASAEQVDQARTALRSAEAAQTAAALQAQSAHSAVSGVEALVAKRQMALADIALAELQVEFATVRAPFEGRVIGLRTTNGQFAAAGHPLFTLADTRNWYIFANFRETDLDTMKPGSRATVYVLADSSKKFTATVESIGYGVHPDDGGLIIGGLPRVQRSINWVRIAQRFPVRFLVENPDPELFRIGASAVVLIEE